MTEQSELFPDRNLAMELVRVTEAGPMAAGRWVGREDKNGRDGAAVDTRPVGDWNEASLIQAMVNRPIEALFPERNAVLGEVMLDVQALGCTGRFADVSFAVRAGEVVGIGGLIGAGRTAVSPAASACALSATFWA